MPPRSAFVTSFISANEGLFSIKEAIVRTIVSEMSSHFEEERKNKEIQSDEINALISELILVNEPETINTSQYDEVYKRYKKDYEEIFVKNFLDAGFEFNEIVGGRASFQTFKSGDRKSIALPRVSSSDPKGAAVVKGNQGTKGRITIIEV